MNNRSWALRKAYAAGRRVKATCSVCGKPVYNRLHYTVRNKGTQEEVTLYAHQGCVPDHSTWMRTW